MPLTDAPVAVASTELRELIEEPTPPRALDSLEAMLDKIEEPCERTLEMMELPEAEAELMPEATALDAEDAEDAAEAPVVDCAEAAAPRARTRTDVERILMCLLFVG
jgi:hypothetical protein